MGWFTKNKESVESQTQEKSKSAVWDSELSKAVADARKGRTKRVSGTKGNEQDPSNPSGGVGVSSALAEQARKLFEPDAWRAIVRAPFALGKAMTGRECWDLADKQEDTLAVSTAMSAEYFMQTDPKWVALTLCMFNWSVILTEKLAANARERHKELEVTQPKVVNGQTPAHLQTVVK